MHLDLLVSALLGLKAPSDPMDKKQVLEFIKSINFSLGINGQEVQYDGRLLSKYYLEDCCDEEEEPLAPFARLPEYYLASAVEGFKANFRPWVLKLLLDFKPYRSLLVYAREHNLIEGTFGQFQAQTSKHKAIIKEQEDNKDRDWNRREILAPQAAIASMKENQWAFKAIFQKAMVRLGRMVEFEFGGEDKNLGNIDALLKFLDYLYEKDVLKVDAELPEHSFRLWTFIALNPGNEKIKVAKTVEDKILSLLCLWYFGSRKIQIDSANNIPLLSSRKLLNFFAADKNTAHWPGCKKAYDTLYKGFEINTLYGKNYDTISDDRKKELVRDRFSAVLAAGLPRLGSESSDENPPVDGDEPGLEQET